MQLTAHLRVAEFFAGIGLARMGLESAGMPVTWSNDISLAKHYMFKEQFGQSDVHVFHEGDLAELSEAQYPWDCQVAWASFPCTDLSLAGTRGGLGDKGGQSWAFWHFIQIIGKLRESRPRAIVLENVSAFASSRRGRDLQSAIRALNGLGYSVDLINIDARSFLPQSRPRLFIVALQAVPEHSTLPHTARPDWVETILEDGALSTHRYPLPDLPEPTYRGLGEYLDNLEPWHDSWWNIDRVQAFTESLSKVQSDRFQMLVAADNVSARTAYRRMREGCPRWEIRADNIAGCLRTSGGGSSKQAVVFMGRGEVHIRWLSPREYAKLMGAPNYNWGELGAGAVYSGFGDAVCVPVVEWIAKHYLIPALDGSPSQASLK